MLVSIETGRSIPFFVLEVARDAAAPDVAVAGTRVAVIASGASQCEVGRAWGVAGGDVERDDPVASRLYGGKFS